MKHQRVPLLIRKDVEPGYRLPPQRIGIGRFAARMQKVRIE